MSRALDVFAVLLLASAAVAFAFGIRSLGEREDFRAVYLLVVGGNA
jgi:hypothetical protein